MVRASRRYLRYNRSSIRDDDESYDEPEPAINPKEEEKRAYKKLKEAQEEFQKIAWQNRNKLSAKQELVRGGKALFKGSGKAVDAFFDANKSIGESVERDIRRHSLEGKIDNTIIDWLKSEKKSSSKKKTTRPERYVKFTVNGKTVMINEKDLPRQTTRRKR